MLILIVNILCLIGSLCAAYFARKCEHDAHTYTDGAHESAMSASRFRNTAATHASSAADYAMKAQVFSGSHEICNTCNSLVARFEKSEDGSVKCFNCK